MSNLLRDDSALPALRALLDDVDDLESEFRPDSEIDKAYEQVKSLLGSNAGARGPRLGAVMTPVASAGSITHRSCVTPRAVIPRPQRP